MKLEATTEQKFPKLVTLLKQIPKMVNGHKNIKDAMKFWGEFSDESLAKALKYGTNPILKAIALPNCGLSTPSKDKFLINESLITQWSNKPQDDVLFHTLLATILHEVVHWGDSQDGVEQTMIIYKSPQGGQPVLVPSAKKDALAGRIRELGLTKQDEKILEEGEEFERQAFRAHACSTNNAKLREKGVQFESMLQQVSPPQGPASQPASRPAAPRRR